MDSVATNHPNTKTLNTDTKQILEKIALTIRGLSIDAVQKANSGHPGLPMGCAELGAYLYGITLNHNPKNPNWLNRDHLILSAGHGSMWLYSCLHLSGFAVSMDDIKHFRQLHSITPGHPESLDTPGVETTTGPLGQGFGNAVGMALGLKILAEKFNTNKHQIFDSKVFTLMGDGCIMEGVTSETGSLAGHLKLNNLIAIYDSNHVSLDGPLSQSCSEDTKSRYQAYGWDVYEIDGHDLDAIAETINKVRVNQERPGMIIAHTVIGKGSPHKAGSHKVHGAPLGPEEVEATKKALGLPEEPFYVPQVVYDYFHEKVKKDINKEEQWKETFTAWKAENPDLAKEFEVMEKHALPVNLEEILWNTEIKNPIAGRVASHQCIQELSKHLPQLYGGSADLSCSDMTMINAFPLIEKGNYNGRNFKFGVREFGMSTMATGMAKTELIRPFVGTFLVFSDYMRNAVRLCSLMKEHVIYQFTHDSIFLGEDGPTHQPVEHLASLRAIPNLHVMRPADANEVRMAWISALQYNGPTALILSRQGLPELDHTKVPFKDGVGRGAYIIHVEKGKPDYTLIATGSEVHLAIDVAEELEKHGKNVRVVSMPCWEIFDQQNDDYRQTVFGGDIGKRVSIEAGTDQGWHKYIGMDGTAICVETFGASAPLRDITEEYGFTVESILERIL